jgi:DNA sulfur modification protein DndC
MAEALEQRLGEIDGKILMITGVRQGESAIRDDRIAMSCGKDGAECGQGWYQEVLPNAKGIRGRIATLAPLAALACLQRLGLAAYLCAHGRIWRLGDGGDC